MNQKFKDFLMREFEFFLAALVILAAIEGVTKSSVIPINLLYLSLVTTGVGVVAFIINYIDLSDIESEDEKAGLPTS